jgi:hypothetical protein
MRKLKRTLIILNRLKRNFYILNRVSIIAGSAILEVAVFEMITNGGLTHLFEAILCTIMITTNILLLVNNKKKEETDEEANKEAE